MVPSSSGLGLQLLKLATRVRIPLGLPIAFFLLVVEDSPYLISPFGGSNYPRRGCQARMLGGTTVLLGTS